MLTQLNPQIPVYIIENTNNIPSGTGLAFAIIDYSIEQNVIWGIALDKNGEIWWVMNNLVRFQSNRTIGRNK